MKTSVFCVYVKYKSVSLALVLRRNMMNTQREDASLEW